MTPDVPLSPVLRSTRLAPGSAVYLNYRTYSSTDRGRKLCQHSLSTTRTSCEQLLTVPTPEQHQSYYRDAVRGSQASVYCYASDAVEREAETNLPYPQPLHRSHFAGVAHLNVIPMTLHQPLGYQKLGPSDLVVQGCHLSWNRFQLCSQLAREIFRQLYSTAGRQKKTYR